MKGKERNPLFISPFRLAEDDHTRNVGRLREEPEQAAQADDRSREELDHQGLGRAPREGLRLERRARSVEQARLSGRLPCEAGFRAESVSAGAEAEGVVGDRPRDRGEGEAARDRAGGDARDAQGAGLHGGRRRAVVREARRRRRGIHSGLQSAGSAGALGVRARIMEGDMRDRIAELDDESVDAIVTDPPYHLTSGKNGGSGAASVNLDSPAGRARVTTGFMGMTWDGGDLAARPETWAPLLRVAKPGAHLVAFGGSRTFHRVWCAVEDAGWEIRDTILWLHGEGFPKSLNLEFCSLADRRDWTGFGTALKPAFEPIILARKPLIGTVTENLIAHGVGALAIDACRVEYESAGDQDSAIPQGRATSAGSSGATPDAGRDRARREFVADNSKGRWPANVLHDGNEEVVAAFPNSDTIRIEKHCPDPELRGPRWGTLQGNRGPRGYDGNGS